MANQNSKEVSSIIMLYSNLQYAEIPPDKVPQLIEKSYKPVFSSIAQRKNTKILLGITGRSIELLEELNPEVFDLLKKLVKNKKVFIVGGTYTNPILPLLSEESRVRQIKTHQEIVKKYFNTQPIGFCPPEFAWDPSLSATLDKLKIKWTIIPQHLIYFSQRLNELSVIKSKRRRYSAELGAHLLEYPWIRKLLYLPFIGYLFNKEIRHLDHSLFYIKGANEKIIGIPNIRTWTGFVNMALKNFGLQSRSKLKRHLRLQARKSRGYFIPYLGDIENIEYGGNSPVVISVADFNLFLDFFEKVGFKIETPDEFLKEEKIDQKIYIKAGSGEPTGSFDLWTKDPDNFVLEKLCAEVRRKLENGKAGKKTKQIEKYLMLAENADGRAWNPVPERRLDCFKAIEKALELLKK